MTRKIDQSLIRLTVEFMEAMGAKIVLTEKTDFSGRVVHKVI